MTETATGDRTRWTKDRPTTNGSENKQPKVCKLCTLRPAKVHLKSSDVHLCYECENSLGETVSKLARVDLDDEGRERRILLELEKLQIRDEAKRRHADGEQEEDDYWPEPVDLTPYLEDTVTETVPTIGALRDDGQPLLYEAKWHTLIAPTTAGKSWFAAWQTKAVLESGGAVAYAHFEDAKAKTTVNRLRQLGVDEDAINEGFFWVPLERPLKRKSMSRFLQCCTERHFKDGVRLLILDGIKAACTRHGWDVWLPSGVGAYAETLVYPATALGTTVLSLGHPVKDTKRANERHGYGAGDWLEIVDGVGFRMVASKTPTSKGERGHSDLYAVKDREGGVETHGRLDGNREDPWFYLGAFTLDDRDMSFQPGYTAVDTHVTTVQPTKPAREDSGHVRDKYDHLADSIAECLPKTGRDGTYESQVQLSDWLRADRVQFDAADLRPAIERMMSQFRLVPVVKGTKKGGKLIKSNNPDHSQPGGES